MWYVELTVISTRYAHLYPPDGSHSILEQETMFCLENPHALFWDHNNCSIKHHLTIRVEQNCYHTNCTYQLPFQRVERLIMTFMDHKKIYVEKDSWENTLLVYIILILPIRNNHSNDSYCAITIQTKLS